MRGTVIALVAVPLLGLAAQARANDLNVAFSNCVESIGVGLAPTAQAQLLTPPEFQLVGALDPVTPVVVRTARCRIGLPGLAPHVGSIVQVGAVIVPPDFTGDINNATFWDDTDDLALALLLRLRGVKAQFVPTLTYGLASGTGPVPLLVTAPWPAHPPLAIEGTVVPPSAPAGSFVANWWSKSGDGTVKMQTTVPVIAIGTADLTLSTPEHSALARLFGSAEVSFPALQQFNTFAAAGMVVSR